MINLLKNICKEKVLAAIYTDRNNYDIFSVKYILSVRYGKILIMHFNRNGEFDGETTFLLNDIEKLSVGDKDCVDLELLINSSN